MTESKVENESLPNGWRLLKVDDIKSIEKRAIITGPFGSNIGSRFFVEKGIPVIRGNNLSLDQTRFIDEGFVFVTPEKADDLNTWAERGDIVLTAAGTLGQVGVIEECSKYSTYVISNKQMRLRVNKNIVRPLFVFYWLTTSKMVKYIQQLNTGSTVPLINLSVLRNLPIVVPSLAEQDAIIELLDSVDSKIKVNQQTNELLEKIGQALFKHWFVDFEFPNKEGKPYKSSSGEMVYNETLGSEIPEGWQVNTLDEISFNFDSKRVPLSSREREKMQGNYPYYGATGIFDYVNDFIFDGTYTLMGEDGTVIDEKGFPVLQLVRGKFWVNNHAHILQGRGISTELLFLFLKNTNVQHIVTGAVQPKINHGNMNTLKFVIPDEPCKNKLQIFVDLLYTKIGANDEQIQTLIQLRDLLLPKIMSGNIRVPIDNKMGRL